AVIVDVVVDQRRSVDDLNGRGEGDRLVEVLPPGGLICEQQQARANALSSRAQNVLAGFSQQRHGAVSDRNQQSLKLLECVIYGHAASQAPRPVCVQAWGYPMICVF